MSLNSRICAFLVALLLCLTGLVLPSAAAEPTLSGECACLYLPQNDAVLYQKNAYRRHPMASTTKIMTALVAMEACEPDEIVTVAREAVGVEGSSIYLQAGEHQTMENLLYALLLESANDAAAAIAIHTAGSLAAFADRMNARAAELGLTETHFMNPHGLADPEHYTTAADLAKITAAAMENPLFRQIVSTRHKVIKTGDGASARSLSNHNKLLRSYEDCVGVKTGFTKISGRCLVSAAERNGMLLIAVTLDAPDDWRDHAEMLDYGFSLYEGRIPQEGFTCRVPVVAGTLEEVGVSLRTAPRLAVKRGSSEIEVAVELNHFAVAPIREGQVLGMIHYRQDGKTLLSLPLLADHAVAQAPVKENLWDKIKNFLKL